MEQFNLKAYKKNPKRAVVARDGRKARIVCTDMAGPLKVLALVKDFNGVEMPVCCNENGHIDEDGEPTHYDIMFEKAATVEEAAREYAGNLIGKILAKFPTDAAGNYYLQKSGMKYLLARLFDEGVAWRGRQEESHK